MPQQQMSQEQITEAIRETEKIIKNLKTDIIMESQGVVGSDISEMFRQQYDKVLNQEKQKVNEINKKERRKHITLFDL